MNHAIQLKNDNDFDGAVRALAAIVKAHPDYAPARGLLGGIYLCEMNRPAKALPHCRRATTLSPHSELASLGLFHTLWALERHLDALAEARRFLGSYPSKEYTALLSALKKDLSSDARARKHASR